MEQVTAISNSNEEFTPDDLFTIDITQVQMSRGRGRQRQGTLDFANLIIRKQSIIEIKNKDQLSCALAAFSFQRPDMKKMKVNSL